MTDADMSLPILASLRTIPNTQVGMAGSAILFKISVQCVMTAMFLDH